MSVGFAMMLSHEKAIEVNSSHDFVWRGLVRGWTERLESDWRVSVEQDNRKTTRVDSQLS
jgi:hypothetical protein